MPMCHPFQIAAGSATEIVRVTALAVTNVSGRLAWADTPAGVEIFRQQMATQTVLLPFGTGLSYEVAFSIASVAGVEERCLNIAVPLDIHLPFPSEAEMIAHAFGFKGMVRHWTVFRVAHQVGLGSCTITMTQPVAAGAPLPLVPKRRTASSKQTDAVAKRKKLDRRNSAASI